MKRYDVFYYKSLTDTIQERDIIIHAESDAEAIKKIIAERKDYEMGIKVDTKEKNNYFIIWF